MTINIIHPTRNRKEQAFKTASKWLFNADRPDLIDYTFSIDIDDSEKWYSVVKMMPKPFSNYSKDLYVIKNNNKSAIQAINFAAGYIHLRSNEGENYLLLVVSDDTDSPEHWDTLLLNELNGKSDFCAKVDDGLQPTLVTMPIMDRIYYERYGYIYNPEYRHMFCDQELTAVAIMIGKYIKLPLTFNHLHYTTGKTPKDALNARNDATWYQGETLFNERMKTNFGIDNPVVPYSSIIWR